jgi:hypothetical protein
MNPDQRRKINMSRFLKCYLLSLLLLNLTACSSMQTVSVESAMQNSTARGIDYGSLVEVRTLDKKTAKFRVTELSQDGLGGKPGFYRYEDMKSLRVENQSANNSDSALGWILGALGIAALIALVANADSVAICSGTPCPQP